MSSDDETPRERFLDRILRDASLPGRSIEPFWDECCSFIDAQGPILGQLLENQQWQEASAAFTAVGERIGALRLKVGELNYGDSNSREVLTASLETICTIVNRFPEFRRNPETSKSVELTYNRLSDYMREINKDSFPDFT